MQHHIHTQKKGFQHTHTLCTRVPADLLSQVTQGAIRSISLGVIQHHIHTSAAMPSESCSTIYTPKKRISAYTHTLCTRVPADLLSQVTQGAIRSISLQVFTHLHNMDLPFTCRSKQVEFAWVSVNSLTSLFCK